MDIAGRSKAKILAALYNRAKPQGRGIHHVDSKPMTEKDAQKILDSGRTYFDYLGGRVMKVDLAKDKLDTRLYNRDNGPNAAETAILTMA